LDETDTRFSHHTFTEGGLKVISSQNNTDSEDDADNGEFGVGAVKHKNPDYKFGKIKYPKAQS